MQVVKTIRSLVCSRQQRTAPSTWALCQQVSFAVRMHGCVQFIACILDAAAAMVSMLYR